MRSIEKYCVYGLWKQADFSGYYSFNFLIEGEKSKARYFIINALNICLAAYSNTIPAGVNETAL